jgi:N-terminal region of Chorein or VPS13
MIAGMLRGVLLRFASEYMSNVDVNKLSLWSGQIALHNVNLNASAITQTLNLPFIRLEQGRIQKIELSIPWTSLSTKKVTVKLKNIFIHVFLTDNLVNLNKPPAVSETEENLLSKILANLSLEIENLSISITMSEEASYIALVSIQNIKINTTNSQWQEEFLNPFKNLSNGMTFRIYRKIDCMGFSCQVISGKKDEDISEAITSHKFQKQKCGGCPLCFGFKNSSFYTLFKVSEVSTRVLLFTSDERSTSQGKHNHVQLLRVKSFYDANLQFSTGIHLKFNLVGDKLVFRDLNTALSKFIIPDIKPVGVQESNSWLTWGKDMLFSPFYCTQPSGSGSITDKIASKHLKSVVFVPSFIVKLRIHNLQELKTLKYIFSAENFNTETILSSSERLEGSIQKHFESKNTGNLRNLAITCYEKHDCVTCRINSLLFTTNNTEIDYELKQISVKVIKKGQKVSKDSLSFLKLIGNISTGPDFQTKFNCDPIELNLSIEEINLLSQSVLELKNFYSRVLYPGLESPSDAMQSILLLEKKSKKPKDEELIQPLKDYAASLALQLEQKIQECNLLRKALSEVAGSSGIAGILNIDTNEILIVSEKGKIEDIDVSLVLTKEFLYVVTKEGRILNKNPIEDMIALEERGSNELSVRMKTGKYIRSAMDNKKEFVQAIKSIFKLENS